MRVTSQSSEFESFSYMSLKMSFYMFLLLMPKWLSFYIQSFRGLQYVKPSLMLAVYLCVSHYSSLLTESAKDVSRYEVNGSLSDSQAKPTFSYRREPSYFEIPTKESQARPAKKPETQVQEVPTKDTPDSTQCVSSTPTPPVVQSHASFTIEFDECTPGKMKIKDHVTKFSFRQRKQPSTDTVTAPTEVMSAESKVADWLVQSNATMLRRRSHAEDMYSTNSDPSLLKFTKGESLVQSLFMLLAFMAIMC